MEIASTTFLSLSPPLLAKLFIRWLVSTTAEAKTLSRFPSSLLSSNHRHANSNDALYTHGCLGWSRNICYTEGLVNNEIDKLGGGINRRIHLSVFSLFALRRRHDWIRRKRGISVIRKSVPSFLREKGLISTQLCASKFLPPRILGHGRWIGRRFLAFLFVVSISFPSCEGERENGKWSFLSLYNVEMWILS